ncbi:MAG: hypothetical protein H7070_04425 [Saprospiraceae bacterium]|nr:hypothetical protein [Pyrinomonadaceae bacterium]
MQPKNEMFRAAQDFTFALIKQPTPRRIAGGSIDRPNYQPLYARIVRAFLFAGSKEDADV